jgi:hypothetical protein
MDANVLIAVAGTLAGVVISAFGTYIVQKKVAEKERKWSLESEERKKNEELEKEKRKIRHDLICERLNVVEETANIIYFLSGIMMSETYGEPIYSDTSMIQQKRKRFEEISGKAWAALEVINSPELKEHFKKISSIYGEIEEYHEVSGKKWEETHEAFQKLEKRIDDIKLEILAP